MLVGWSGKGGRGRCRPRQWSDQNKYYEQTRGGGCAVIGSPHLEIVMPFPSPDTVPPVTMIYFICFLVSVGTGFGVEEGELMPERRAASKSFQIWCTFVKLLPPPCCWGKASGRAFFPSRGICLAYLASEKKDRKCWEMLHHRNFEIVTW